MLSIHHGIVPFCLFVGNVVSLQVYQMAVHQVNILTLHDGDGRQLAMLLHRFLLGLHGLGIGRAVTLHKCELTILVVGGDDKLFHGYKLLRPLRRGVG